MRRIAEFRRDRLLQAWLLLCAVTVLSLVIGGSSGAAVSYAVLAIAFAKAALVMWAFMDLRGAPLALRVIACTWLFCALCVLLAVHAGVLG